MKTKPWLTKLLLVLAVLALVPVAAQADVFWDVSPGTGAPPATLGGYAMTAFPADPSPIFSVTAALPTPIGGALTFTDPTDHRTIGGGWATWSHGYTGDVYYTLGALSLTMGLPASTGAFYFYAEPNPFGVFTMTARATDGSAVATVSQLVDGAGGASYFGVYTLDGVGISSVTISSEFDFAVGEFGIARTKAVSPEPSSLALLALGTLGLAAWRRKKV